MNPIGNHVHQTQSFPKSPARMSLKSPARMSLKSPARMSFPSSPSWRYQVSRSNRLLKKTPSKVGLKSKKTPVRSRGLLKKTPSKMGRFGSFHRPPPPPSHARLYPNELSVFSGQTTTVESSVNIIKSIKNGSVLLFFYMDGCGFCKVVEKIWPQICDHFKTDRSFILNSSDVENQQFKTELVHNYSDLQRGYPLLLRVKNNKLIGASIGAQPIKDILINLSKEPARR